jgi:hypothetical protein
MRRARLTMSWQPEIDDTRPLLCEFASLLPAVKGSP